MSGRHVSSYVSVNADAVEHLRSLLPESVELERLLEQERLRVRITDGFRRLRAIKGLSQADIARRLGISQGRVSRLESADLDRRLDSVAAYLHAVGARTVLAFEVDGEIIPVIVPENVRVEMAELPDSLLESARVDLKVEGGRALEPSEEASFEFEYYAAAA